MNDYLQKKVNELITKKRAQHKRAAFTAVVSVILAITVFSMTMLPAITMSSNSDDLLRTAVSGDITVSVTLSAENKIPNDAKLIVTPITKEQNTDEYNKLFGTAQDSVTQDNKKISDIVFFDIRFNHNGENIEPEDGTVKVSISFSEPVFSAKDVEKASDLKVLHFADDGNVSDVTDVVKNADEGVTAVEFSTDSFSPYCIVLADTYLTGNFYQRVSTINSTSAYYLIVSTQGNYALSSLSGSSYAKLAQITPVKGNAGYYKVKIGTSEANTVTDINWQFNTLISSASGTSRIQVNNTSRLYLGNNTIVSSTATAQTLNYDSTRKCWSISYNAYYLHMSGGVFSRNNGTTDDNILNRSLIIYKLVNTTLTIPGDVINNDGTGGSGATKPTYPAYITPSGAKSAGYTAAGGKTISAVSDAATSQIENQYLGVSADDGKVVTDKSVIYRDDDYDAFSTYGNGIFGVTMSVVAQEFNIETTETYEAPIDVILILDTSGSMTNHDVPSGETRAQAMVTSVNRAIDYIMSSNPDNRVGVVNFSSGSWDFMQLRRYYVGTSGATINYTTGYNYITLTGSTPTIATNTALRYADTKTLATSASFTDWSGTYTQAGIAQGAAMLLRNANTTIQHNGQTVNRTPVMIMLSDGDPTHCTSNYTDVLNGPHYGDGVYTEATNNEGVMGYYTILSGLYYKNLVGIHYAEVAKMFTIGMGIYDTGYNDMSGSSATGDHYKRAVLNPTASNIANLYSYTAAKNYTPTALQMYQLLNGTYASSSVTVGTSNSFASLGRTNRNVPVLMNQYSNYKYVDSAFFGDFTSTALNTLLQGIITSSHEVYNYGFILEHATDADMTDPIGVGMEVKGAPILRFVDHNYTPTSTQTTTENGSTIVTYRYNYTYTDAYNTKEYNLANILVTLTKESNGNQTLRFFVPEIVMPVFLPDATRSFYYESLPARLIYQVGMTDSALAGAHKNDVFYTNRWTAGDSAMAVFEPTNDNPFYVSSIYQEITKNKTSNPTATSAVNYQTDLTSGLATHWMGNNGKLTITDANETTLTVQKTWRSYDGAAITDPAVLASKPNVTVNLFRGTSPGQTGALFQTVSFGNANSWRYSWSSLPRDDGAGHTYYYYITENTVNGYYTTFTNNTGINNGTITINNTAGGIIMPATGGTGTGRYIAGGLFMIILSIIGIFCLMYIKKKHGRRFIRPPDG